MCASEMTLLAQDGPTFPPGIEVHLACIPLEKVAGATFSTRRERCRNELCSALFSKTALHLFRSGLEGFDNCDQTVHQVLVVDGALVLV